MRLAKHLAVLSVALSLAACATPRIGANVTALRASITAAEQQARLSFEDANAIVRDVAIDRKLGLNDKTLAESDFPVLVDRTSAQQWDAAFDILDQYAAALQSLVDARRAAATGDALSALGAALNGPTVNAKLSPGLQGLFAAFGQAIVQGMAERDAARIMQRTDPAFRAVTDGMAAAIGDDPAQPGTLILTVNTNWRRILQAQELLYADPALTDPDARRAVIEDYLAGIDRRDDEIANLIALNSTLQALGEAHRAAGSAQPGEARFWLSRIESLLTDIQRRIDAARARGK